MKAYKVGYWSGVLVIVSTLAGALALACYTAGLALGAWSW